MKLIKDGMISIIADEFVIKAFMDSGWQEYIEKPEKANKTTTAKKTTKKKAE